MRLSAPKTVIFIIAVVIAILAALAALGIVTLIPIPSVWLMAVAFVVLAGGCVLKGV